MARTVTLNELLTTPTTPTTPTYTHPFVAPPDNDTPTHPTPTTNTDPSAMNTTQTPTHATATGKTYKTLPTALFPLLHACDTFSYYHVLDAIPPIVRREDHYLPHVMGVLQHYLSTHYGDAIYSASARYTLAENIRTFMDTHHNWMPLTNVPYLVGVLTDAITPTDLLHLTDTYHSPDSVRTTTDIMVVLSAIRTINGHSLTPDDPTRSG